MTPDFNMPIINDTVVDARTMNETMPRAKGILITINEIQMLPNVKDISFDNVST